MFFEIIIAILAGVYAGTFTGLIPGIHVNLVCAVLLSASVLLIEHISIVPLALFIIAMAVTHTFIDVIPSVFLGAPDPDMVLSVLPGHKLLFEGRGYDAVRLTQIGGLGAIILSALFFPTFITIIKLVEPYLEKYMFILLLMLVLFLLLQDLRVRTVSIFCAAGLLGYLTFSLPYLHNPIFPLLTGLFGVAGLILAEKGTYPKQRVTHLKTNAPIAKAITTGQASGFLTAVFPGLGSASAAALSSAFVDIKEEGFLVLVGTIGTVNFALSLATFYVLQKARNGAIIAVQTFIAIPEQSFILAAIGTILLAGGIASVCVLIISKKIISHLCKLPYERVVHCIMAALILLTAILSGWYGLLILATASALGVLTPKLGVARMYLMGCLLIPTLGYVL